MYKKISRQFIKENLEVRIRYWDRGIKLMNY